MPNATKNVVSKYIIGPLIALKRYLDALKEISKVKKIDTKLHDSHIQNTRVLIDREKMLTFLKPGGVVAEVGVADGQFSQQILNICHPKELHLIDYWSKNKRRHGFTPTESLLSRLFGACEQDWEIVNKNFKEEISNGRVVLQQGYSWEMLEKLPDHSLDWVYIDAGHDYSSVTKDLDMARKKVKPEGLIAGHDYWRWGKFGVRCGVVEAVNEFCIKHDYELLYLTVETKIPPSFAIRKLAI